MKGLCEAWKCHSHANEGRGTMRDTCSFYDGWWFSLASRTLPTNCSWKIKERTLRIMTNHSSAWSLPVLSYLSVYLWCTNNVKKRFKTTREGNCETRKFLLFQGFGDLIQRTELFVRKLIQMRESNRRQLIFRFFHPWSAYDYSFNQMFARKFPLIRAGASRFSPSSSLFSTL